MAGILTLHICSLNSHDDDTCDGVDAMINDVILSFIGIVLISLILAVAYG